MKTNANLAIIAANYHDFIVQPLIDGALKTLNEAGYASETIHVMKVPGAWELPVAAQWAITRQACQGVIALGCVLRGDTAHFDHVAGEAARGLAGLAIQYGIPVTNGVLACDNLDQALDRAGGQHGNKGVEAANALIAMLHLSESLK